MRIAFLLVLMTIGLLSANAAPDKTSSMIGRLKYVPAGSFQRDAIVTNISSVDGFWMSEYEVTRDQYKRITGSDPSDTNVSKSMNDPVQQVSWKDALMFCNRLSIWEGLTPVYSAITEDSATVDWAANGYRLPTEMEWMWAAMGADNSSGSYMKLFAGYNGNNELNDYAWTWNNSGMVAHSVGGKLPNELGIYDLSGSMEEWCWDRSRPYPQGELKNFKGDDTSGLRVLRGGSFFDNPRAAKVSNREESLPTNKLLDYGIRVIRK